MVESEGARLSLSCVLPATQVCLCEQKSPEYSSRSKTVDATSPHGGAHTGPASTSMEDAETQTVLRVGGSFARHSFLKRNPPGKLHAKSRVNKALRYTFILGKKT